MQPASAAQGAWQAPGRLGAVIALSALLHGAAFTWAWQRSVPAHEAPAVPRIALRWIAAPAPARAAIEVRPAAPAPAAVPLRPVATSKLTRQAPPPAAPAPVPAPEPAPAAATSAPTEPISGAVFALPRIGFPAGAGPWAMRRPGTQPAPPATEDLAAQMQARAARESACARQAALNLQCDEVAAASAQALSAP